MGRGGRVQLRSCRVLSGVRTAVGVGLRWPPQLAHVEHRDEIVGRSAAGSLLADLDQQPAAPLLGEPLPRAA